MARGEAAIGGRLAGGPTVEGDVALQHRQQAVTVGRVSCLDHQIEDHAAPAGGQVELVAVFGIAAAFDDDIGMRFEQADDLIAGSDRFAVKNPPLGLRDDPHDQRAIVVELGLPDRNHDRVGHVR
jgi:hypothetical protein